MNPEWTKGKSGNPGGRPKMSEEHRKAFTEISEAGINALRQILANPESKDSDKIKAADVAFDRAWGKAPQHIDANVNDGSTIIDTSKLSTEKLAVLAEIAIESLGEDDTND